MKKILVLFIAVAVLAGGALVAVQARGGLAGGTAVAQAAEIEAAPQPAPQRIIVDARVVPAQRADLSLSASGVVSEIMVDEGDQVEAGQILLRLGSSRQQAAVAQAQAQLRRSQAQLAELETGARVQELASAQAALAAAQARQARIVDGPLAEDVDAAQAALAEASASLQKLLEGPSGERLISAQAELANAEAQLRQAQAAYDRVKGNADIGARPESAQLEQATNAFIAARARLDDLDRGASAADIAAAQARVRRARAQLEALQATNPADLSAAEADVRQFQAQLDLLGAGARPESIAVAEADVAGAQASLDQALAALAETELRAPFSGIIASLDANVGEQLTAGTRIVRLANLSAWEIETEDLTEFDAVRIRNGMTATVTFDAIPDLRKEGTVKLIRPIGEDLRGDIVYTVVIEPDANDDRLLWNLTAVVTIDPAAR